MKQEVENSHNPDGVDTEYLWLDVLTKDSILQLVESFIFMKSIRLTLKRKLLSSQRYHQRRAVSRLLEDMKTNHTDNNLFDSTLSWFRGKQILLLGLPTV